ncbi:MAG TPA: phosphodiester glycosidase family protein [Candidatus Paenibacillus intestinavium]|nr:phosphodiester glycosidase family protein [Candidatus Paenibacillus intestinavium]
MRRYTIKQLFTKKKAIMIMLTGALVITPIQQILPLGSSHYMNVADAATNSNSLVAIGESIVSAGVVRKEYTFKTTRNAKAVSTGVHVMEIDLSNPYISLQALSGTNGQVGKRTNVMNMASNTGAIAAINGDVFVMKNEGTSLGSQIIAGSLVVSPSLLKGMYAFGVTTDKKPTIDMYTFEGNVQSSSGQSFVLSGINQSTYSSDVTGETYSHSNKLYIYTSSWSGAQRPINSGTTPTEVLVVDNVVQEIVQNGSITTAIPSNGYILRGHKDAAQFLVTNMTVGSTVEANYNLVSQTTKQKVDPAKFEMMVSGHTLLVENGKASSFSRDISGVSGSSYTSRTAIGYSADGKKVYMVTAEKSGANTGLSLKELQTVLVSLGAHKAVNMDGGGSTTMVERKLGYSSLSLAHVTQESSLRSVANGIGVFTTAPQGSLKGLIISGSNSILIGQSITLNARAYDSYYNPISADVSWSSLNSNGSLSGDVLTAKAKGTVSIKATSGSISALKEVNVVGGDQIASLVPSTKIGTLSAGSSLPVTFKATLKNGETHQLDGNYLKWDFVGFSGTFKDGNIIVNSVNANAKNGYAVASYDGFTTMIPYSNEQTVSSVENFNAVGYAITNQVLPADVTKGSAKLVAGSTSDSVDKALQISYDFSEGTGTKASYAKLGDIGRTLSPNLTALAFDVNGDGSNNWLRAEIVDGNSQLHYVDIAKSVDWTGWKNIKVNVDTSAMKGTIKLRRVYMISLDSTKAGLASSGQVTVDNIMQYSNSTNTSEKANTVVKLYIDKKQATVNGKSTTLDAAPILKGKYTYLPLRFVTEQLGATLDYDNATKTVKVFSGSNLIQMTIGKKEYVLNGVRYESDVAPFTTNNRTLIPVRLFSEKLGFEVNYNHLERSVTIQ